VLFRLLGIFAFVPFFSNSSIPGNVKVLLGLAIALCVWNIVPGVRSAALTSAQTLPGLVAALAGEMTVGLLIGVMLAVIFGGIQMGAHLVSQQMGLSLAAIYDPAFEDQSTVIEQVAFWIALVTFLTMGGHRAVINAVVYSYQRVPLGGGGLSPEVMLTTTLGTMDASFHAATRVAMPALVAFFVATLTAGLMARSMPQMNLMTVGIALHLIVGFVMVAVGLVSWAAISRNSLSEMFRTLTRVLSG
jgi:flagellar biosynthesis protein FliR